MVARSLRLAAVPVLAGVLIGGGVVAYRIKNGATLPSFVKSEPARMPDGLVVSTDRLDFGPLDSGRAVMRQVLLRNQGNATLHLSITDPGDGVSVEPTQLTLEPGAIGRVYVKTDAGVSSLRGALRIVNDADATQAHTIALAGGKAASAGAVAAGGESGACGESNCNSDDPAWNGQAGSVSITRGDTAIPGAFGSVDGGSGMTAAGSPTGVTITHTNGTGGVDAGGEGGAAVPIGAPQSNGPHSMADRPTLASSDAARDGETPQPLHRPKPERGSADDDAEERKPGVSMLAIGPASLVQLMGASNRFYPQSLAVLGNAAGGAFTLASSVQLPRVPLAFGESMEFSQQGSVVGTFDPVSGQVNMTLPIKAVDSGGNAAPVTLALTTGTVVTRNPSGVLVSLTGTARNASGELRLVGLGKIPPGFGNGAEEQLVTVDLIGTLHFADPAAAQASNSGM